MTSLTRGPLPAGVYWRRRLLVLGAALALVVALATLLGGGSDGSEPDRAAPAAAEPSADPTTSVSSGASEAKTPAAGPLEPSVPATPGTDGSGGPSAVVTAPVLAEPEGRCESSDVSVTPEVEAAIAGAGGVEVLLHLRTAESEACTWRVSPGNVTVKITSGTDDIWSSRECPKVLPAADVVVRDNVTTTVALAWNGRRSDEDCSPRTDWAMPGTYHVTAAALGGEPSDVRFLLEAPVGDRVTETAEPTQAPDEDEKSDGKKSDGKKSEGKKKDRDSKSRG